LPPEHYDQIFSARGTLMIFFVAMPFVIGLMNFVVPLQLGVRDVAFPTLNSVGFWLTARLLLYESDYKKEPQLLPMATPRCWVYFSAAGGGSHGGMSLKTAARASAT
jgi:hypothetical protein